MRGTKISYLIEIENKDRFNNKDAMNGNNKD